MYGSDRPKEQLSDSQRIAWLRLIRSSNVGPTTFRQLINKYGTAEAALDILPELTRRGGGKTSPKIATREQAEQELEQISNYGARMVAIGEPDYPYLLQFIHAPPPLLTIMGNMNKFADKNSETNKSKTIAIVGASNASAAGKKFASTIAAQLGEYGYIIVSGLARGIDAAAHTAALPAGTIAVYAGGLDQTYPPQNIPLAEKILDSGGLLISEMAMGYGPRSKDFPRRNRLVSGMAKGILVIEAAKRSGSLITARYALEQNREVFAAPGFPMDPRSGGTNRLIRDGANLVTCVQDIIDELEQEKAAPDLFMQDAESFFADDAAIAPQTSDNYQTLEDDQQILLEALSITPIPVDDLITATALPAATVQTLLMELDLAGRLERSSGQLVALI